MRKHVMAIGVAAVLLSPCGAFAQDPRELVALPHDLQEDMLNSMQDHLIALDTILSHIASERYAEAAKLAEQRLTVAPADAAKAARINDAMPREMRLARDGLREAAIRLAGAARKADSDRSYAAMTGLTAAVSDVTAACTGCHAHYRIR